MAGAREVVGLEFGEGSTECARFIAGALSGKSQVRCAAIRNRRRI